MAPHAAEPLVVAVDLSTTACSRSACICISVLSTAPPPSARRAVSAAPSASIASNTSTIPITWLAQDLAHPRHVPLLHGKDQLDQIHPLRQVQLTDHATIEKGDLACLRVDQDVARMQIPMPDPVPNQGFNLFRQ